MKASAVGASLLAVLASMAGAQPLASKPFYLVLQSENPNLDGIALSTCHEGAAIESICKVSGQKPSEFKFKRQNEDGTGLLLYTIPKTTPKYTESLSFYNRPESNVALPLFGINDKSEGQLVGFENTQKMYIESSDGSDTANYHWYMCKQEYSGYTYNVLSWIYGKHEPDNETCKKVNVKRVFA